MSLDTQVPAWVAAGWGSAAPCVMPWCRTEGTVRCESVDQSYERADGSASGLWYCETHAAEHGWAPEADEHADYPMRHWTEGMAKTCHACGVSYRGPCYTDRCYECFVDSLQR